ncbi:hypothetical protein CHCC14557_1461 [Bacillus licheniformis]|nr:hypothetical protein CHCC14557_1461 [Bacillus licheniformis]
MIAFSLITFLHVVVGELAPKTLAIQKAEAVSFLFAKPLIWFYRIMFPFGGRAANPVIRKLQKRRNQSV